MLLRATRHFARCLTHLRLCRLLLLLLLLIGLLHRNLTTHKHCYCLVVHSAEHRLEEVERLKLINQQRIFLLIAGILNRLAQLVEFTQMLLPRLVDRHEQNCLLPCLGNILALGIDTLLHIYCDAKHALAVGDRHAHHSLGSVLLHDAAEHRQCHLSHALALAAKCGNGCLVDAVNHLATVEAAILGIGERHVDGKHGEHLHAELLIILGSTEAIHHILHAVVDHVHYVDADALSHEGVVAAGVNHVTLGVHHVVVFEEVLADAEVVLLHALLCVLD